MKLFSIIFGILFLFSLAYAQENYQLFNEDLSGQTIIFDNGYFTGNITTEFEKQKAYVLLSNEHDKIATLYCVSALDVLGYNEVTIRITNRKGTLIPSVVKQRVDSKFCRNLATNTVTKGKPFIVNVGTNPEKVRQDLVYPGRLLVEP